jgi:hypothetical protein
MMERTQILAAMGELKLYGMKAAFDEIITAAIKRQHEPRRVVGDLLTAEISEKQARSIKYQITIAKLPLAKDVDDFVFDDAPVNETLVRDLASGDFMAHQRNVVLVGGTGTGKTHLAIAIARSCIRGVARRGGQCTDYSDAAAGWQGSRRVPDHHRCCIQCRSLSSAGRGHRCAGSAFRSHTRSRPLLPLRPLNCEFEFAELPVLAGGCGSNTPQQRG